MNTYGKNFRITLFGESHGKCVGVVIDGITPGLEISEEDFKDALLRRQNGDLPLLAHATTARKEDDIPVFLSGILDGKATGSPVAIIFQNNKCRPSDYQTFKDQPRPSHADYSSAIKYNGFNDIRGSGQFSGRMTLPLAAAGVVARKVLGANGFDITIKASVKTIAGQTDPQKWEEMIHKAQAEGDSLGGEVECRVEGLRAGVGNPFFSSMESEISRLAFSVPGVKGIQFGDFSDLQDGRNKASHLKGSEFNDPITDGSGHTSTNHSGGINGGISNGNPVVFTLDIRPAASISKVQKSFNFRSQRVEEMSIGGRHDACIALRCPVIAESIAAIVLADMLL
ncbi:MAG: chorismate synthase [Bacteroidales bacterium]|nr:chorismate synthase [Bacteroidales bacterium]